MRNICRNKERKHESNAVKWLYHELGRNLAAEEDFLYPKNLTAVQRLSLSKVIRSSNCGNDASKEVEADVVMWLDPKEPVKLGLT